MANPVAAHTFQFDKVYVSTRTAPGTWSTPVVIFNNALYPALVEANTFSAGALTGGSDPRGIVARTHDATYGTTLSFLGDGLPDVPVAITFAGQSSGLIPVGYWDVSQGAVFVNSAYYLPGFDASGILFMLKSTDNGVTWSKMDDANAPLGNCARGAMQRIDHKYYFFLSNGGAHGPDFELDCFDMDTDTWAAPTATLVAGGIVDFGINKVNTWSNGFFVFPNGDFGLVYCAASGPAYRLYSSGVWGSPIAIPGNQYANIIIDPSLELLHVFAYDTMLGGVIYSTVAHDGTVTPSIFTFPPPTGASDGIGHGCIEDSQLFVPYDDANDFTNAVWVAPLATGAFVKELLPVPAGEVGNKPSCAYMMFSNGYALIAPVPATVVSPAAQATAQMPIPVSGGAALVTAVPMRATAATGVMSAGSHECAVPLFIIHKFRFRQRVVGEYIDGTINEYYESPEFSVAPGRVGELKDFLVDYDISAAGGRLELYGDLPNHALALVRTLAIPYYTAGRQVYAFPLENPADVTTEELPAGQLFKVRLYPPPGGILRLHGRAVFRARVIGVYFEGQNGEVFETQDLDLAGGMGIFRNLEITAQTSGAITVETYTELPNQDMRLIDSQTINPRSTTTRRLPVILRLPGNCKGELQRFRVTGSGSTRILGMKVLGRRLEVNGGAWQWYPIPFEATLDAWMPIQMPVRSTPEAFDWVDVPVDAIE